MTIFNRTHLLALASVFSLVALPAMAQEGQQTQTSGSVTVGAQTGTGINTSSKLQEYETVPTGVSLFHIDFDWKNASKYFITFEGNKLGLDDQSAAFQAGQKGTWTFNASLDQNLRWFSNTGETLYTQSIPGVFTLPDGMLSNLQQIWYPATGQPAKPASSADNRFWSLRDYMNGAQPVDLKYIRKTGRAAFDFTALKDLDFTLSYLRETRNGSQPVDFTAGPGIDEVANPIQYTTQDVRLEVNYTKKQYFLNGVFGYNWFTNAVPYTTVDNPDRLSNTDFFWTASPVLSTSTNATGRLWNAPDNSAVSFDVTGGFKMPSRHKLTVTASRNNMAMDRTLVPQATNPYLNLASNSTYYCAPTAAVGSLSASGQPCPTFSLSPEYTAIKARLVQTLLSANFTGDPSPYFGYSASYRYFDLANNTPVYTFHSTVNSDGGASYSPTGSTATGEDANAFKTTQFKLEAHASLAPNVKVGVNGGQVKSTYEDRMYQDVTDNTVGVTFDSNISWAMFHGSFTYLDRQPGLINAEEPAEGVTGGPLDIHADMKDVARQHGKIYNAALTLTPIDKTSVTFSVQGLDSDYPDVSIGLRKSTMRNAGVDLVYAFTDKFSANGAFVYEVYRMNTNLWYSANGTIAKPVATNTTDQYYNTIGDIVHTYRAGFRWDALPGRADVTTDYNYSKGRSDSGFTITPGGVAGGDMLYPTSASTNFPVGGPYLNYPEVFNATTIWKTQFNFHVDKNLTFSLLYWFQKFDHADWAYDGIAPYMLPGAALYATTPGAVTTIYPTLDPSANQALFLNAGVPNYKASILRASITYRF
jgi:Putative outer membrane beta-barrel porin, MtrB/PioB